MAEDETKPYVFSWHDEQNKDSFLSWLVVSVIAGNRNNKVYEKLTELDDKWTENVRITIQINGVEMDPKHFLESLENNYKWNATKEAKKILEDSGFQELNEAVYAADKALKRAFYARMKKIGLEVNGEEDCW